MKNVFFSLVLVATILSCKNNTEPNGSDEGFAVFGAKIPKGEALTFDDMAKKYESLKPGDTANVKFESTINAVCKKKGCWMRMDAGKDEELMVRFKDYEFFVPKCVATT